MAAPAKVEMGRRPLNLPMRPIDVSTMYAWTRVLEAYTRRHATHEVEIFYQRDRIRDLKRLVQFTPRLDPAGFSVRVQAPDGNVGDIPRLLNLLEQAAGPEPQRFMTDHDSNAWFTQPPAVNGAD